MKYSLDKYKFYTRTNKNGGQQVIAISTYAGKTVRGVANCDPRDTFSIERGKELAAARCNLKIAEKRAQRAERKVKEAMKALEIQKQFQERMNEYQVDAMSAVKSAQDYINRLLEKM